MVIKRFQFNNLSIHKRRAAYPIQQRQIKVWKALFYELVNITVTNAYLLSLHTDVPKKHKFTNHKAFRIALYNGLFGHAKPASTDHVQTQHQEHKLVRIKLSACIVCKAEAGHQRRKKLRLKAQALQEISPNNIAKSKDNHVHRPSVGCDFCKVNLCSSTRSKMNRQCWEIYHRGQK